MRRSFLLMALWIGGIAENGQAASTTILINEVETSTPGSGANDSREEWVELKNISNGTIQLGGWKLQDDNGTDTLPSPLPIGPGCTVILVANAGDFRARHPGFQSTTLYDLSGESLGGNGFDASGDHVNLRNSSDQLVDCASWGDDAGCFSGLAPDDDNDNQSYQRTDSVDDDIDDEWVLTNNTPEVGCSAPPSTPTFTMTLTPTSTNTVLTEVPTETPILVPTRTFTPPSGPTNTVTRTPRRSATPTQTFTVTRTPTITQTPTITLTPTITRTPTPGPAVELRIEGPTTASVGTAFNLTVSAKDARGFDVPQYRGRVRFYAYMDPAMQRPPPYQFTASDAGRHAFTGGAFKFTLPGTQRIEVVDEQDRQIRDTHDLQVNLPAMANHFYVSKSGSNSRNGQSPATAWATLTHAVATAPANATIHVLSSPQAYQERVVLRKPLHLIGDTINGVVLDGGSQGTVLRIEATATGSSVRRFTIINGRPPTGGNTNLLASGVAVYAAQVTLTNLLIRNCRAAIHLNEVPLAILENLTLHRNTTHAVEVRYSQIQASNIVLSNTSVCPLYSQYQDDPLQPATHSAIVGNPIPQGCSQATLSPPPTYWDENFLYLNNDCIETSCPDNENYVDAGNPGLKDVDGSPSDLGVYGGPRGEMHYRALQLPAILFWAMVVPVLLGAAWRRRRQP